MAFSLRLSAGSKADDWRGTTHIEREKERKRELDLPTHVCTPRSVLLANRAQKELCKPRLNLHTHKLGIKY